MSNKSASIVVRCLNELSNLKVLVPLLEAQEYKGWEVVFVDSGSDDGTLEFISNLSYLSPDKYRIKEISKEDFTFGKSLNLGFTAAQGELVVSLSAHCFPKNKFWLDNILSPFNNPAVGIVYGKQSAHKETRHSEASVQDAWFGGESRIRSTVFLNNGNAAYRKGIWDYIKFDEHLTGLEDIDFGIKADTLGWKIFFSKESEVEHLHRENYKTIRNRYRRESEALRKIFPPTKKARANIETTLFDCFFGLIRGIIYDVKVSLNSSLPNKGFFSIFSYRVNQYIGTYIGYKRRLNKNKIINLYFYPPKK